MKVTKKMLNRISEIAKEINPTMEGDYARKIYAFLRGSEKMAKSNKEPWLQALRSGEYTKAKGWLANPENHQERCCLGVAYGVCGLKFGRDLPIQRVETSGILPSGFMGLTHGTQTELAALNDSFFTHAQIADLIEEFL